MIPLPGDFAVIPIKGTSGMLISIGEWLNGSAFGDYDHAEIYVGMADKKAPYGYTMGAYPGGAGLRNVPAVEYQHGWLWSTERISLSPERRSAIVSNAMACKGVPYSALDYFALAAHRLHIPAPLLKDYIASSKHMICSQLVDYVYMNSGLHLFADGRWPGYVTPADLAQVILNYGRGIVAD